MQTFRPDPDSGSLTMTQAEAEALLRIASERAAGTDGVVSTADLAEALRLPEQQVRALLDEVRRGSQHDEKERAAKAKSREHRVMAMTALMTAIAFIAIVTCLFVARAIRVGGTSEMPPPSELAPVAEPFAPTAPADLAAASALDAARAELKIQIDGKTINLGSSDSQLADLLQRIKLSVEDRANQVFGTKGTPTNQGLYESVKAGNFDGQGIEHPLVEVRWFGAENAPLLVAKTTVPIYSGGDSRVADLLRAERLKRYQELARQALDLIGKKTPEAPAAP